MFEDRENKYRPLLENDPPAFLDKVNTPWDRVPDLPEYNQHAYNRIVRALKALDRERAHGESATGNTQGLLILGEAGTGKTHLLMRVARNLSAANHILFVNKPANQHAVAQHIWSNVVKSLARSLPESGSRRSQLDDLLAHVFRDILVPRDYALLFSREKVKHGVKAPEKSLVFPAIFQRRLRCRLHFAWKTRVRSP